MSPSPSFLLTLLMCCFYSMSQARTAMASEFKPRLVVMTDICPADLEPDDTESAIRLMAYADRFEIEAIITTVGWNCDPYPADWAKYLDNVIDKYETDLMNFAQRSNQKLFNPIEKEQNKPQRLGYWPSPDYLRSRALMGSQRAGIGVIGEGNDSEGSRKIIELLDEDDSRPIFFCAWGSANTLAQAIWRLKQERSEEELKKILHKIRLYTITDQDMVWAKRKEMDYSSHQWLRREFANDLILIWDESAWLNQNSLGSDNWDQYARLIQGHGALGSIYPKNKYGVEGDTPSFLHCMPNGLNDPSAPMQVGWGGYHEFALSPDNVTKAWTNWHQPVKSYSDKFEKRFYTDIFNDFASRMQWAAEGHGTTNPVVIINGKKGIAPVCIKAKAGQRIKLNARKSYDPEKEKLDFLWWEQTPVGESAPIIDLPTPDSPVIDFIVPPALSGKQLHLICEVHDNSPFRLASYRRVIIDVSGK